MDNIRAGRHRQGDVHRNGPASKPLHPAARLRFFSRIHFSRISAVDQQRRHPPFRSAPDSMPTPSAPAAPASPAVPSIDGDHRAAVLAGFLGWTLDAFDFFLVVLCLTAIAQEFGKSDTEIALSITLTLAFRPVGAFIFGLLADRYGRRLPLMIDLVFYSHRRSAAPGLRHSFTTFLILRALFGIGMGGEWGVGASLAMEKVPPRLRGLLSGLLQQGYAAGYLLAALATSSCSRAGAGGRCSSSAGCRRCSRSSCACA